VDWMSLVTSVVGCAVFALLVLVVNYIRSQLSNKNPHYRRQLVGVIGLGWLLCNIAFYYWAKKPYSAIGATGTTLLFGWVVYTELGQFWRIGLVGADAETAKGIDYIRALDLCTNSLEFLGIGAGKLTSEHRAFDGAIDRCHQPDRAIRFLLSRPDNLRLQEIALNAGVAPYEYQRKVRESLRVLANLRITRQKNIEVNFYSEIPVFRLMFINEDICLASHYVLGKGDGSQTPQLHVIKTHGSNDTESLFYGFKNYFDRIWRESEAWDFKQYLESTE